MSRFSIVVPLVGKLSLFEDTLASVLRYRCPASQIIVAHANAYEDPYGLGKEVDFVAIKPSSASSSVGLIELFNAAVRVARGEFVALIRPGAQLRENWDSLITLAFSDPNVGSVAPALVAGNLTNRIVAGGITAGGSYNRKLVGSNQRFVTRQVASLKPLGPTSWAAFYRRSLLTAIGEADEQLDPMYLDLDLALSLKALNFGCEFCPDCVVSLADANAITGEAGLPHGRSAQRAVARYSNLLSSQQQLKMLQAMSAEIAVSPWQRSNLLHAWQRLSAAKYRSADDHHRSLIAVLKQQRQRLVGPQIELFEVPNAPVRSDKLRKVIKRAA